MPFVARGPNLVKSCRAR